MSARTGEDLVAAALEEVQAPDESSGLFVVQPPAKQWENYAKHLNCCFLLADRLQETLWIAWSGHSKTVRIQGVVAKPSKKTLEAEGAWERAKRWMMADFGFRRCPIFEVEVLEVHDDEVVFSRLRCFFKDAPTILAASRRPCRQHLGATDPLLSFHPPSTWSGLGAKRRWRPLERSSPPAS